MNAPLLPGRIEHWPLGRLKLHALAVATQIMVFPWFVPHLHLGENLMIGAVFVGTSLLGSYTLRRLFARLS